MSLLNRSRTKKYGNTSQLFLIEMIMALLFLCISGAVVMTVFASAAEMMQRNELKDNAVLCAQSCAEVYSVTGSIEDMTQTVFGKSYDSENGSCRIELDRKLRPSDSAEVELILTEVRSENSSGALGSVTAVFLHKEQTLYTLTFAAYTPDNGGDADE